MTDISRNIVENEENLLVKKSISGKERIIPKYRIELNERQHPIMVCEEEYVVKDYSLVNPDKVASLMKDTFNLHKLAEEHIVITTLNSQFKPTAIFNVSHGGVRSCPISNREIFIRATLAGAVGIMICHNHPSGLLKPSKSDLDVSKKIKEAGILMGIQLIDFLILTQDSVYSFKEKGHL